MSEHTASQDDTNAEEGLPSRRLRLRDLRIRTKLALILIAPLLAISGLAGVRLVDSAGQATQAQTLQSLVAVSAHAATLVHELHGERMAAAGLLADPAAGVDRFSLATGRVDSAVTAYRGSLTQVTTPPAQVTTTLTDIEDHLDDLVQIRAQVTGEEQVSVTGVVLRYSAVTASVYAFTAGLVEVSDDPVLARQIRAVAAWSTAKLAAADTEAIAVLPGRDGTGAALAAQAAQAQAFAEFEQAASGPQRATAQIITVRASQPGMRLVQDRLHADLYTVATQRRDAVVAQVVVESVAVGVALAVTIATALLLAWALARSLRRLQTNAMAVARRELPKMVARLADPATVAHTTPEALAAEVRLPAQLDSRDEIGQVAHSFTVVQRAAVRIAAEQAALRTSVAEMFLSLARRSQTLVDSLISRLDKLQAGEQDPDKLKAMFALDNLATRMRRNDENLLVLAGADSSPPRLRDVLIGDVLRAAQSEIEHYARVEFGGVDDDVWIVAAAINDVVRLVAELLDNATRFSPPHSPVVCEARRLGDQLIIQVEDRGVGMTTEDEHRINGWLQSPGVLDVAVFRRMGIAVVAKLAARHHITVQVRTHPQWGTTAAATLPPHILVLPASRTALRQAPPRRQVVAPPTPAHQPARQLPARSAEVVRHHAGRRDPTPPAATQPTAAPRVTSPQVTMPPAPPRPLPDVDVPVAGRPAYHTVQSQPPQSSPVNPPTIELPIFRELADGWFRDHGHNHPTWPTDQPHPPNQPQAGPVPQHHVPPQRQAPPQRVPEPAEDDGGMWRTAADAGWEAAAAAASPTPGGATTSGLPKRVPQAQLVPGGVQPARPDGTAALPARHRTPEQVRGLLSAYQRGVQRGRSSLTDDPPAYPQGQDLPR